jgi:hypothetical protein
MLKKLVRGSMVALVAMLPFLSQPMSASAAGGTLFGITSGQLLVKIDPATGAFTQVQDLNTSNQPQSTNLVSDPQHHMLFALRLSVIGFDSNGFPIFTDELLNIDSQTGALVAHPTFPGQFPQALVFDTGNGTLFGQTQTQIVKVDPSTAAIAPVANIPNPFGVFIYSMAIDSSSHTIYLSQEDVSGPIDTNTTRIFAINDSTGVVSPGVLMDQPVRQIAVDGGQLFGVSDCCVSPSSHFGFVSINKSTGATTLVADIGDSSTIVQFGTGVDPSAHTVYLNVGSLDPITFAFISNLLSINDQTGASLTIPLADGIALLGFAFETPPPSVTVTPDSIIADVKGAVSSGAITSAGLANSLTAELNQAKAARSRGDCTTAASIYQAFINEVMAQSNTTASGVRPHISAAKASQLIGEAQFLIANCP